MELEEHYRRLEALHRAAPVQDLLKHTMSVREGAATLTLEVEPKLFHAAEAMHGAFYFKCLDDAAFFAAQSVVMDCFILTASFTTYLTRPVPGGKLTCEGKLVSTQRTQWIAEAVLTNEEGKEVARGNGLFRKSAIKLMDTTGYGDPL